MKLFLFLFLLLSGSVLTAQGANNTFDIALSIEGNPLELEKNYFVDSIQDSLSINKCKFYLSDIHFVLDGIKVDVAKNQYNLVDFADPSSLVIQRNNQRLYDVIEFSLGIDSITNVSGAYGGDLDPTLGMYWAWQSGYINFKLEGESPICESRNNVFQFHLGGYMKPNLAVQRIVIDCSPTSQSTIELDLHEVISFLSLKDQSEIMRPSTEAVQLSEHIAHLFKIRE